MTDTIIAGPKTLNEAALSPSIIINAPRIKERDAQRGRVFAEFPIGLLLCFLVVVVK